MFSLTQLPVTKYRACLKALKKHIHAQGVHSRGDTQADNGQQDTMASELSWRLAAGESDRGRAGGALVWCHGRLLVWGSVLGSSLL